MEEQFIKFCKKGYLNEAKEFLRDNPDINISALNDLAFRWA